MTIGNTKMTYSKEKKNWYYPNVWIHTLFAIM